MTTDQMNARESLRYDYERLLHRVNVIEAANKVLKTENERLRALVKQAKKECVDCNGSGRVITWDMNGGPPTEKCAKCAKYNWKEQVG